jgi:hypothetical protein
MSKDQASSEVYNRISSRYQLRYRALQSAIRCHVALLNCNTNTTCHRRSAFFIQNVSGEAFRSNLNGSRQHFISRSAGEHSHCAPQKITKASTWSKHRVRTVKQGPSILMRNPQRHHNVLETYFRCFMRLRLPNSWAMARQGLQHLFDDIVYSSTFYVFAFSKSPRLAHGFNAVATGGKLRCPSHLLR